MIVIPIETWKKMVFDKDDLIESRIRLSAANKGGAAGSRQDTNISPKFGEEMQFVDDLSSGGESR